MEENAESNAKEGKEWVAVGSSGGKKKQKKKKRKNNRTERQKMARPTDNVCNE